MNRFGPHGAALGLRFYTGRQFPAAYRHSLFIAQHGSWNRSRKSGYRVLQVLLDDNGKVRATRPFRRGVPWRAKRAFASYS